MVRALFIQSLVNIQWLTRIWKFCGVEEVLRTSSMGHPGVSTPGIEPLSTPSIQHQPLQACKGLEEGTSV